MKILFVLLLATTACTSIQTTNQIHIGMEAKEVTALVGMPQRTFKDKDGYRHIYRMRRNNFVSWLIGVGTLYLGNVVWEEDLNTDCIIYFRGGIVYRDTECKRPIEYEPVRATEAEKCPYDQCVSKR